VNVSDFLQCDTANTCNNPAAAGATNSETNTDASVASGASKVNFWKIDPTGP
jgi:hypothetical protein